MKASLPNQNGLEGAAFLRELEASGAYLFHGSPLELETLEPRQAQTENEQTGQMENHGEPAVCLTPFGDVAIFRAIVNKVNCPEPHQSSFGAETENGHTTLSFRVSPSVELALAGGHARGKVYVFNRAGFERFSPMEYRAAEKVVPLGSVDVSFADLPNYGVGE